MASVEKRLQRLEGQVSKLNNGITTLRSDVTHTLRSLNKEISDLYHVSASLNKNMKLISVNDRKAISQEAAAISDKISAMNKRVNSLEALKKDFANLSARENAYEKSWNPAVLKRVSAALGDVNSLIADIKKKELKTAKTMDKMHYGMIAISKHARDIEGEHHDAKTAAKELANKAQNLQLTVDHFFRNMDSINNKITANSAGLTDVVSTMQIIKDKLESLENQSTQLAEIKDKLEQNFRVSDQLAQRVAYLEKSTVKTIVLE